MDFVGIFFYCNEKINFLHFAFANLANFKIESMIPVANMKVL